MQILLAQEPLHWYVDYFKYDDAIVLKHIVVASKQLKEVQCVKQKPPFKLKNLQSLKGGSVCLTKVSCKLKNLQSLKVHWFVDCFKYDHAIVLKHILLWPADNLRMLSMLNKNYHSN